MKEAILLAAGYGRGLEPITHTRHKVLVPLLGSTLLEHHISSLTKVGVERLVIVVNYLREQVVAEALKLARKYGVEVEFIDQDRPLGTGHALLKAADSLTGDRFLLVYGDIYLEQGDLGRLVRDSQNLPAIAAYRVNTPERYGVILADTGMLKRIIEKPVNPPSNLVNAGAYILTHDILNYVKRIEPSPRGELELTDAINEYARNSLVRVVELSYWIDVGRPWSLLKLNRHVLEGIKKPVIKGRVEDGVKIKGGVVIEEGAEVRSGTYIVGPAYIGKEATVGPNAFIRPYSAVLEGAHIGFNVEVKESIVMERAHIAHQAYVGDSIVCEESNLGAGTILANLRFDDANVKYLIKGRLEDTGRRKFGAVIGGHVKTGVNVSTVPGVKIGACSWVNPGLTVYRDVPPCTHVVREGVFKPVRCGCVVDLNVWRRGQTLS